MKRPVKYALIDQLLASSGSAHATEYSCGCIQHPLMGLLRRCPAQPCHGIGKGKRKGKPVRSPDGSKVIHDMAEPVRYFSVNSHVVG